MAIGQEKDSKEKEVTQETPPPSPPDVLPDAKFDKDSKADLTEDSAKSKVDHTTVERNKQRRWDNPKISITEASSESEDDQKDVSSEPGDDQKDVSPGTGDDQKDVSPAPGDDQKDVNPEPGDDQKDVSPGSADSQKDVSSEPGEAKPDLIRDSCGEQVSTEESEVPVGQSCLPLRFMNYVSEKFVEMIVIAMTLSLSYAIYRLRLDLEEQQE